jgi:hypothetical protein
MDSFFDELVLFYRDFWDFLSPLPLWFLGAEGMVYHDGDDDSCMGMVWQFVGNSCR